MPCSCNSVCTANLLNPMKRVLYSKAHQHKPQLLANHSETKVRKILIFNISPVEMIQIWEHLMHIYILNNILKIISLDIADGSESSNLPHWSHYFQAHRYFLSTW